MRLDAEPFNLSNSEQDMGPVEICKSICLSAYHIADKTLQLETRLDRTECICAQTPHGGLIGRVLAKVQLEETLRVQSVTIF